MFNRTTYIIIFSFGLISCSAPDVKPQDANLLEAAVNLSSGEFEGQLTREQFKLQESRELLDKESEKEHRLNTELQTLTSQKQSLDNQLANLQNENRRLVQLSNQTKAETISQQRQRQRQQSKINSLNTSITKLKGANVSQEGNDEYKTKISSLQKEIELLREMISNQ